MVLKVLDKLPQNKVGAHLGDQLFRSGTSVGAHLQEARGAESRADFIHKMSIALKDMREARYWLALIAQANILQTETLSGLLNEAGQLVAILSQSLITAKSRQTAGRIGEAGDRTSNLKPATR